MSDLAAIQERLGLTFADPSLLQTALTHSSWAHERGGENNERLEFLGDAVLQMSATLLLMELLPAAREGELSRLRSELVKARTIANVAQQLQLGPELRLGIGMEADGGRTHPSVLADAFEALLGAVHRDAGFEACLELVRRWMLPRVAELLGRDPEAGRDRWKDPCSRLQELCQARDGVTPRYVELARVGPPHDLMFTMGVSLGQGVLAEGTGRTKREASRAAAQGALLALGAPAEVG